MISRRVFFGVAAGVSAAGVNRARPAEASMCNPPSLDKVPVRKTGKVEIAFKSPGPQPNGLQATSEGLWIIDQSRGSRAYLVGYDDGRVLRSFETDTVRPSGITFDGQALWIGSTFSYENVRCSATTGAVLERRPTPGSIMYAMAGDPPPRRSPLAGGPLAQPRPAPADAGAPLSPSVHVALRYPEGRVVGNGAERSVVGDGQRKGRAAAVAVGFGASGGKTDTQRSVANLPGKGLVQQGLEHGSAYQQLMYLGKS
jgi:hypothetical protein